MPNKDPDLERYEQAWQKAKDEQSGRSSRWAHTTCPEQYDKQCRLCQLVREIIRNKDNYSKELVDYAYDLAQKTKAYINVVLKANPKKVVVLEIGKSILGDLMALQTGLKGDEYRNFFYIKNGRNIRINKQGSGRKTEYEVWPRDNTSAFPEAFMKQATDLDAIESLIAEKKVTPMRAAQLEEGPNEMRILPNWRYGEKIELFFFSIKYHSGLVKSEYELIQAGQFNPFKNLAIPEEAEAEVSGGFVDDEAEVDVPDFGTPAETEGGPAVSEDPSNPSEEGGFGEPGIAKAEKEPAFVDDTPGTIPEEPSDDPMVPPCHGIESDYNTEDEECKECPHFKSCGAKVEGK